MDSRKYRSSSTTEINDAFGIGFQQFAQTGHAGGVRLMWSRPHASSTTCAKNATGAMPVARKLWLMPGAELSKLHGESPAEQRHRA